jgi:hypothetical protein
MAPSRPLRQPATLVRRSERRWIGRHEKRVGALRLLPPRVRIANPRRGRRRRHDTGWSSSAGSPPDHRLSRRTRQSGDRSKDTGSESARSCPLVSSGQVERAALRPPEYKRNKTLNRVAILRSSPFAVGRHEGRLLLSAVPSLLRRTGRVLPRPPTSSRHAMAGVTIAGGGASRVATSKKRRSTTGSLAAARWARSMYRLTMPYPGGRGLREALARQSGWSVQAQPLSSLEGHPCE